jgi:hypothetical protein
MIDTSAGVYGGMNPLGGALYVNVNPGLAGYANTTYDVAVYPFALTPAEIAQMYRLRLGLLQRGY